MYFCQQSEHDNASIEYICLYKECKLQRLCCNLCIQSLNHEHDSFYMEYLENYQVLNNFINLQDKNTAIIMNSLMIDQIVQSKFITIKTADEKLKPIPLQKSRQCHSSQMNPFKIQISNNKKLIVTQDEQLRIKIWGIQNNFKLIKCKKFDKEIKSILFSENDKYLFIGLNNSIIKLDILNHFNRTQLLNFEAENSQVYLKSIANSILLYYYSTKVIKYDYQLNHETQALDIGELIESMDIQSTTNNMVTLDVSNNIILWSSNGEFILQKPSNEYYLQEIKFISFLGSMDIIITSNKNRVAVWNIDYNNKTLYAEKIIYCSQMNRISEIWLNANIFEILLIREHDICTYSIVKDKFQSMKINADYYDYVNDEYKQASYHVLPKNNQLIIIKEKTWNYVGLSQKFIVLKKRQIEI